MVSLWRTRGKTGPVVHRLPDPPGCPPPSTGYPPVIHRLSPQSCGRAAPAFASLSPEPSTGSPQPSSCLWATGGIVHRRPQASTGPSPGFVHSLWVTEVGPCVVFHRRWTTGCGQRVETVDGHAPILGPEPGRGSTRGVPARLWTTAPGAGSDRRHVDPGGRARGSTPPRNARTPGRGRPGVGRRCGRGRGGRTPQVVCLIRLVSSAIWL